MKRIVGAPRRGLLMVIDFTDEINYQAVMTEHLNIITEHVSKHNIPLNNRLTSLTTRHSEDRFLCFMQIEYQNKHSFRYFLFLFHVVVFYFHDHVEDVRKKG